MEKKKATKKTGSPAKPSRKLDGEYIELLEALDRGEAFEPIPDRDQFVEESRRMARSYFKKNARVSFRISQADLDNVKRMAASEGLPYQTFLTSVIHKLTTGMLTARRD